MDTFWYAKAVLFFVLCSSLSAQRSNTIHARRHGVRFPGLGFFSLAPPFNNTNWLPQRPSLIRTSFYLYTPLNPRNKQIITANPRIIEGSNFDGNNPVKILVHGFLQHGGAEFLKNMTNALLDFGPMNVIVVNWARGSGFPYGRAVANTRVVGAEIAKLVNALVSRTSMPDAKSVHIIGHSLGAQIAGYAGSQIPELGRITGLDPAQPNYEGFGPVVRLDISDAKFVDVIHTDARPYDTVGGYGMIEPVGHIDFYPNGGHHQPGCLEETSILDFVGDIFDRGIVGAEGGLSCSHERSNELFTKSITHPAAPCTFRAFPCASEDHFMRGECLHCGNRPCPVMGFHADKAFGARGTFYLNTTNEEPFCGYHLFVTLTLASSMRDANGAIYVQLFGENGNSTLTEISRGQFTAGGAYKGLILVNRNLGHIMGVDVKFVQESSWWSSYEVVLQQVEVNHVMRLPTKYFCEPEEMRISSGQSLRLTSGSYIPGHCP